MNFRPAKRFALRFRLKTWEQSGEKRRTTFFFFTTAVF